MYCCGGKVTFSGIPVYSDLTAIEITGPQTHDYYDNITLTPLAGAIPEPSTWAMTLIGFAGLGFAAYCRAKKSHATFAAA